MLPNCDNKRLNNFECDISSVFSIFLSEKELKFKKVVRCLLDVGHCKISLQGAALLKPPDFHRQAGRPEIYILFKALSGYSIYEQQQKTTGWDIKHLSPARMV